MTELVSVGRACHLLGRLALSGPTDGLCAELRAGENSEFAGVELGGPLGDALEGMRAALGAEAAVELRLDHTRLMVTNADRGSRTPLPVPPYEDCWRGERQVMGPRSRAVLIAYASAGLGFDGMKNGPADHVGLELCFVAALLAEEAVGSRDASARVAFVGEHLEAFLPVVGAALVSAAKTTFWRAAGRALLALPARLAGGD